MEETTMMEKQNEKPLTKVCKSCGRDLPIESFQLNYKAADGRMSECTECRRRRRKKDVKGDPLAKFTARELMNELFKRGYEGTLQYVEVHKITLGKLS